MMKSQLNQSRVMLTIAESTSLRTTQIPSTAQSSHSTKNNSMSPMLLSTMEPTQPLSKHLLQLHLIQPVFEGYTLRI